MVNQKFQKGYEIYYTDAKDEFTTPPQKAPLIHLGD